MCKGLSEQQQQILIMLKTTAHYNDDGNRWFSTHEVTCQVYPEVRIQEIKMNRRAFFGQPKVRDSRQMRNDKYKLLERKRISVYRALRNLEVRGYVKSANCHSPERIMMSQCNRRLWSLV